VPLQSSPAAADFPFEVPIDKVGFIAVKAKAYDAKEGDSDPNSGSNPNDDRDYDVLEDKPSDFTRRELKDAILSLPKDEQFELVALAWIGRGTYSCEEWKEALDTARNEHPTRTAEYLLALPLLGDYLEEGLAAYGEGIVDDSDER